MKSGLFVVNAKDSRCRSWNLELAFLGVEFPDSGEIRFLLI
jgi:hypothetical protein